MNTSASRYPMVSQLRMKQAKCQKELNEFEKAYRSKMNDIYHAINQKEYDMLKILIQNIDRYVHEKSIVISQCYANLRRAHMKYVSTHSAIFRFSYSL